MIQVVSSSGVGEAVISATFYIADTTLAAAIDLTKQTDAPSVGDAGPIDDIEERLLGSWDDFDQTYLALQRLWIMPHAEQVALREAMLAKCIRQLRDGQGAADNTQYLKVDFLLDFHLGSEDKELINEQAVMSLIGFRRSFERLVNNECRIAHVEAGCVVATFVVMVPKAAATARILGLKTEEVGKTLLEQKFGSEKWRRISTSYRLITSTIGLL